ncbi:MAG: Lpg1974 family pore-forming outer membrane protein [Gemmataceae bacterium]|nr:Lpg1974 family pore-forming outer membrane protein [Gemmataceae bacterium]
METSIDFTVVVVPTRTVESNPKDEELFMRRMRLNWLSGFVLAGLACAATTTNAVAQSPLSRLTARTINISEAHRAREAAPAIPVHDSCPERTPVWSVYADLLYWTARGDTVPYAQVRDGAIFPPGTSVPVGETGRVDSYYSPGFRVGAGALLTSCVELDVMFTWWQNRSTDTITTGGATFTMPLTLHPNSLNANITPTAANGRQDIHLYQGDINLKYAMCTNGPDALKLVIGARLAHLDQNFQAYYFGAGSSGSVLTGINFDGFGPKIGLEGTYTIWGCVFAYGRTDLSLLYGHFGADFAQAAALGWSAAATQYGDDRVVPIFDAEIGLGWRSCNRRIEALVGYSASNWFNAMTTSGWIEAVQGNAFAQNRHNVANTISFDGLFARLAVRF